MARLTLYKLAQGVVPVAVLTGVGLVQAMGALEHLAKGMLAVRPQMVVPAVVAVPVPLGALAQVWFLEMVESG